MNNGGTVAKVDVYQIRGHEINAHPCTSSDVVNSAQQGDESLSKRAVPGNLYLNGFATTKLLARINFIYCLYHSPVTMTRDDSKQLSIGKNGVMVGNNFLEAKLQRISMATVWVQNTSTHGTQLDASAFRIQENLVCSFHRSAQRMFLCPAGMQIHIVSAFHGPQVALIQSRGGSLPEGVVPCHPLESSHTSSSIAVNEVPSTFCLTAKDVTKTIKLTVYRERFLKMAAHFHEKDSICQKQ
ncbi:hypothetical protein ACTXT7_006756 [Hymenolepis weldensis]